MLAQCPVCKDICVDDEPCSCVFFGPSILDAKGMLHTAPRIAVDANVVAVQEDCYRAHEQLAYAGMYHGPNAHATYFATR